MIRNLKAFTIFELLIVVVLAGMIAGFGIPTYNRARERADEKEAVHNLRVMGEALEIFRVRNDGNPPTVDFPQILDINNNLDLGIIERNVDYSCATDIAQIYRCTAVSTYGWEIIYQLGRRFDDRVRCSVAGCLSCPAVGCVYAVTF